MTAAQLRSSPAWKRARALKLRGETHCELCHRPLDFDAPPRSPWAPSVDHIVPLALGGAPFDQENLRAAHVRCNSQRGDGHRRRRALPARLRGRQW